MEKINHSRELIDSNQSAFDFICNHLLTQMEKSLASESSVFCSYWSKFSDLKCAVGCLIDEVIYDPSIEGAPSTDQEVRYVVQISNPNWEMDRFSEYMLERLQNLHDNIPVDQWEAELRMFADVNDLKFNFNNQVTIKSEI